jgi:hypothetical protein
MSWFGRSDITIRCGFRGAALTVPNVQRLLDACPGNQHRRLRRRLARISPDDPLWSVQWLKSEGDRLAPNDIIAALRHGDVVVEVASAQRGLLSAVFVPDGERVRMGVRLAALERRRAPERRKPPEPPQREEPGPANEVLRQFVARQRRDAGLIASLQSELSDHQQIVAQLRGEIVALRAGRAGAPSVGADPKFRRLKHEFSKRFHPDARVTDEVERARRTQVFQEIWPILEEIERS